MKFHIGSELTYDIQTPTTMILNIEAQRLDSQRVVREAFTVSSGATGEEHEVPETRNRYRRLVLQPGTHTIRYDADVETSQQILDPATVGETPVGQLPFEVVNHLFPSRYCQSDKLARFAWRRFGDEPQGHARVTAICNWIYENVDYLEGSSDGSTSAYDTFTLRAGVCRDFAHLGITFCRALGIPARFVSAYAWKLEPQDFHAVFEAWLDGRWYLFDPTRLSPVDGVVRIGVGRDAADTAFATFYGQMLSQPKTVWVEALSGEDPVEWTTQAVSVSAA